MKTVRITQTLALAAAAGIGAQASAGLVGLWEFEDGGDLTAATIGTDLALTGTDAAVAGSGGVDTGATQVGLGSYYGMTHGIAPNGGGSFVNEWTLVMDVSYPTSSDESWMSFYNTSTANSNDGDAFFRGGGGVVGSIGLSATGYTPDTTEPDTWYRVVFSVDNGSHYRIYVNGVEFDGTSQGIDGRFSLDPLLNILADNDGEDNTMNLSNLAIYDTALTAGEVAGLGSVGTAIVPEPGSLALLGLGGLLIARRRRA